MRKFSLLFLVLMLSRFAFAQLVAPVLDDVPSTITKTSFYVYITDSNVGEDYVELEISGGGVTRLLQLPAGAVFNQPVTGLMPKTTYLVRARAKDNCTTSTNCSLLGPYSNVKYITTLVDNPPMAVPRMVYNCPTAVGIAWDINS
jgi:hypothetical protein